MVALNRNFTPVLLTPELVERLTEEFKKTKATVWNIDWLKQSLLTLSNGKCAYCECDLKEESKYMEVEHFEDKDNNPDKVMQWDNLLPSCKRCNGAKGSHDVIGDPIVNPFLDKPSNHLFFRHYRMKPKDNKGKTTIDVVNLNHTERAVQKRFEVGEYLEKLIETAYERLELFEQNGTAKRFNKLRNIIEEILKECQPSSIYSATCATILNTNDSFSEIKKRMTTLGVWDHELDLLDKTTATIVL